MIDDGADGCGFESVSLCVTDEKEITKTGLCESERSELLKKKSLFFVFASNTRNKPRNRLATGQTKKFHWDRRKGRTSEKSTSRCRCLSIHTCTSHIATLTRTLIHIHSTRCMTTQENQKQLNCGRACPKIVSSRRWGLHFLSRGQGPWTEDGEEERWTAKKRGEKEKRPKRNT